MPFPVQKRIPRRGASSQYSAETQQTNANHSRYHTHTSRRSLFIPGNRFHDGPARSVGQRRNRVVCGDSTPQLELVGNCGARRYTSFAWNSGHGYAEAVRLPLLMISYPFLDLPLTTPAMNSRNIPLGCLCVDRSTGPGAP